MCDRVIVMKLSHILNRNYILHFISTTQTILYLDTAIIAIADIVTVIATANIT